MFISDKDTGIVITDATAVDATTVDTTAVDATTVVTANLQTEANQVFQWTPGKKQ